MAVRDATAGGDAGKLSWEGAGAFDRGRMAWASPRDQRHVGSAGRDSGGGDTVDGAFAASQSLTASHCSESAPWVERQRHRAVSEVACATLHVSSATPESRSNARSRPFASSMREMTLWQFAIVFAASWTMSASRNVSSSEKACGQKHRALAVQRAPRSQRSTGIRGTLHWSLVVLNGLHYYIRRNGSRMAAHQAQCRLAAHGSRSNVY